MVCLCPKCQACRYVLSSPLSRAANLCFSCRMGIHAGAPLPTGKVVS